METRRSHLAQWRSNCQRQVVEPPWDDIFGPGMTAEADLTSSYFMLFFDDWDSQIFTDIVFEDFVLVFMKNRVR